MGDKTIVQASGHGSYKNQDIRSLWEERDTWMRMKHEQGILQVNDQVVFPSGHGFLFNEDLLTYVLDL